MTYVESRTERAEIIGSIVRILLPLGVLVALWLMTPSEAGAVEGTGALNDPVEATTDVVATTQTTTDAVAGNAGGQGTADSTAGTATDTAGRSGGTVDSTAGTATDTAGRSGGTVDSTAGTATDTAGRSGGTVDATAGGATGAADKATGAVADTIDSTAGAATDAAGKATGAVADTIDSTAGAATDAVGNTTGAVVDTVDSTTGTVVETAKPLVTLIAPTVGDVGDVGGDVVGATLDVVETLSQYATAALDGMTGSAVRLLEDETFVFRTVDDTTVILGGPIPGTGGEGIFEQVIRSLDDVAAVSESRPDANSGVPDAGSTVVDSTTTTSPPSSVDLETAARHHPIAHPAGTPSALAIPTSATSTDVPASEASSTPEGETVPIRPVTTEDAVPTGTAARDTTRGGSSTQDLAALAAAIFIALALVRWSRRDAEFRYSPVFLSLAERPG